jgi:putative ABC transport system ATP-binding protein
MNLHEFQAKQILRSGNINTPRGLAAASAEAALEAVEMAHRLHHRPTELSGGEVQRVAIARALVNNPAVILADEPTGALDSQTAARIMERIAVLNAERGVTFIVVTHDPGVAQRTRRVIRMNDGRIESDSASESLIAPSLSDLATSRRAST